MALTLELALSSLWDEVTPTVDPVFDIRSEGEASSLDPVCDIFCDGVVNSADPV